MFGKNKSHLTTEEVASMFQSAMLDSVRSIRKILDSLPASDMQFPSNYHVELEILTYAAFDFALSIGNETSARDRLRDAFASLNVPRPEMRKTWHDRLDQYRRAVAESASADIAVKKLRIGNVLATALGHENDIVMASSTGTFFDLTAGAIAETAKKCMESLINDQQESQ